MKHNIGTPIDMASLEHSFKSSRKAEKAVLWDRRVAWFASRHPVIRFMMGGRGMLSLLKGIADIAQEDYLQEVMHWH